MGCNPYAEFGLGLTDAFGFPLPACPSAPIDPLAPPERIRTEADFVQEVCDGPRADLERAISGLAEYLRLAGAGDPRLDPRARAPQSQPALYFDLLSRRLDAWRACAAEPLVSSPDQTALAQALIASGQLRLGPEAFTSPDARAALAAGLKGATMASPTLFGIGVGAPGGSLPLSFMPTSFLPTQSSTPLFGGGILGTLGDAAIALGSQYLAQQLAQKQAEDAFKRQRDLLLLQAQIGFAPQQPQGQVIVGADGSISMGGMTLGGQIGLTQQPPIQGPSWIGVGATGNACGAGSVTLSQADSPGLYKISCSGAVNPRSRFYALRSNGTRDLFVRVGTVNSVSPRVLTRFARRWAKQAKLTVGSRSTGRRRARRPR